MPTALCYGVPHSASALSVVSPVCGLASWDGVWLAQSLTPKDIHIPIPGTCDCVTSHGKRDLEDVIDSRILRWGDGPGLSKPVSVITRVFIRGGHEGQRSRSEDGSRGWRGVGPRAKEFLLLEAGEVKKWVLSENLTRNQHHPHFDGSLVKRISCF